MLYKIKVRKLTTWLEKSEGLMGKEKIYPVYFETRFGIHTFGMKVPIDVIILDKNNEVVIIKKNLKPGNLFFWNPEYFKVIELPANFLDINDNDVIHLI